MKPAPVHPDALDRLLATLDKLRDERERQEAETRKTHEKKNWPCSAHGGWKPRNSRKNLHCDYLNYILKTMKTEPAKTRPRFPEVNVTLRQLKSGEWFLVSFQRVSVPAGSNPTPLLQIGSVLTAAPPSFASVPVGTTFRWMSNLGAGDTLKKTAEDAYINLTTKSPEERHVPASLDVGRSYFTAQDRVKIIREYKR